MTFHKLIGLFVAFIGGVFMTLGSLYIQDKVGSDKYTLDYDKNTTASALKSLPSVTIIEEQLESNISEWIGDELTDEPSSADSEETAQSYSAEELDVVEVISQPPPPPSPSTHPSSPQPEEDVDTVLERARELVEETKKNNENQNDSEQVVFTTPSGKKIDAEGNIIDSSGDTNDADDEPVYDIPDGIIKTPSGVYVDENGNIYDPKTKKTVQDNNVDLPPGVFMTPSGTLIDQNGNVID